MGVGFAQKLYCPGGYMLMNLSSEKCKFWASTTRSLSNFDGDASKFEAVVYKESVESQNDSITKIFRESFLEFDSFPEIRLTVKILEFEKMDRKKEFKQAIKMRGTLSLHGVKKQVEFNGNIYFRPKLAVVDYELYIKPEQFDLKLPKDLKNCLSPIMQIKGNAQLYALELE
jgi:polyisoprenoid-binding protein YceI